MLNLYFVFGLIVLAYVIGFILVIKNVACALVSADTLPGEDIEDKLIPTRVDQTFQELEKGISMIGATLRTPQFRKPAERWAR
ncbi:MAG: hypothetical protein LLH30_18475 [Candidatus Manganitrophus sp. SA1]|nr:hypothetical protein [Candidatus Manganitrophus morganii]